MLESIKPEGNTEENKPGIEVAFLKDVGTGYWKRPESGSDSAHFAGSIKARVPRTGGPQHL
jgi:hypothetical protein